MTDTSFGSITDSGSTTDQVKDQVREKAQVAQDKARGALGQARGRLSGQVDQRSTQAGERVAGTASDVRSIAEELRNQGKDVPANLAEQVANRADRVGDYLKEASGDRSCATSRTSPAASPCWSRPVASCSGSPPAVHEGLQQPPL